VIPRIIHWIWVGPDPMPQEFIEYGETWKRHHPDWEFRLWTEDNPPADLRRPESYERLRMPAERSDILRLEVLWRFGGVYLDTDFECRGSIEPLLEGLDFFSAQLKPGRVNNAIIGSVAGHPILDRALDEIRPREFFGHDKAATGPLFFNELLSHYPEVKLFEPEMFYPTSPAERERAIAIHHTARSWMDIDGFKKVADRAEERWVRAQGLLEKSELRREKLERENQELRKSAGRGKAPKSAKVRADSPEREAQTRRPKAKAAAGHRKRAARSMTKVRRRSLRVMRKELKRLPKRKQRLHRRFVRLYNTRYRSTYETQLGHVPDRDEIPELLNRRGLVGTGAEIGVKLGKYSDLLLSTWKGAKLISIDPWLEAEPDEYVDRANVPQDQHQKFFLATQNRLAKHGARSEIWRRTSVKAAEDIADGSLDFVYIDARHDYGSVLEDLAAWFPKVRPGGLIAGHDYIDGEFPQGVFGVKRAVDEFFAARGIEVHSTDGKPPAEMFASWLVAVPVTNAVRVG
jgi:hypothetical protein